MAESKGSMLAKSMQKHAGRAKEKILQNLGKVDRTADEIFDDHLSNFTRQQASANRLQKEFNNYIRCIRAAQVASKSLMDAISEIYEPQWTGYDALQAQTAASESLWQDFAHKLGDQVLIPLNTYTGQFPEMKKKVEKRNRKLIDYDSQRHSFQSLQASANKRKDDVKLTKGREQLEEARRTYEILNTELHDELPALYDSRILFLVTNLQTLFATEQVFHNETAKIYSELEAIVDKLATDSQRGSNTLRKQTSNAIKSSTPVPSPVKQMNNTITNNSNNYQNQHQITTNGSSNVNSPTTSPSTSTPPPQPQQQQQQQPRLDSVSPTPESTPESANPKSAAAATAPVTPQRVSAAESSYQNTTPNVAATHTTATTAAAAAAAAATTTPKPAESQSTPNSLNAGNSAEEQEHQLAKATTPTKATAKSNSSTNDEALNNVAATAAAATTAVTAATAAAGAAAAAAPAVATTAVAAPAAAATTKVAKVPPTVPTDQHVNGNGNANSNVEDSKKSLDATTTDLPPGVLYRVKATYGYVKEDVDELSFEIGDVIQVIEYDDPEDQEEGWLMGQKEGTDEKGLFPANFTRPI